MRFKKLEVFGFKSFADKLEVQFGDGITGIVGPNGCGKSNVADSIRWVLGEQSAKSLRGNNMLDVIFSGTERRKSLSYCEVSLFFDNDDNTLPVEFTEVVISRKLYRSGESEYAINRTPCRLRDVVDLLRDIGIGKEGYSIIGQGRIDALISAKPEDRRGIFEEACGISKFKAKKLETERKLARTRDNLSRINDILTEIDRQLSPLAKQSESARTYLEWKELLKVQELNYYVSQYDGVNTVKARIQDKLNGISEELRVKQEGCDRANREYDAAMEKISSIDEDAKELQEERVALMVGIEKQTSEYNLIQERIKHLKQLCVKLEFDIAGYEQQVERARHGLSEAEASKERDTRELAELNRRAEDLSEQFLSVVDLISKGESEADVSERQLYDSLQKLSDIKANLSGLEAERKAISDRHAELLKSIVEINAENNQRKEDVELAKTMLSDRAEKRDAMQAERNKLALALETETRALEKARRELQSLSSNCAGLESKVKMLTRITENNEGYNNSVRLLLNDCKDDSSLGSRVCGSVAKLMTVPKEYEVAVDVALGAAMQNIVVHTQNDAKALIAYLKNQRYGRVTFLPMDAVKARPADSLTVSRLKGQKGYIGVGDELVEVDSRYRAVYSSLLGRTVICDNIDNAVNLARAINYSMKIVTLEGDVIHPFGAMTGGSRRSEASSLLSAERELAAAKEELASSALRMKKLGEESERLEKSTQARRETVEAADAKLHALELDFAVVNEKLEKAMLDLNEHLREAEDLSRDSRAIEDRIRKIESDLARVDELESKVSGQKESADDQRTRTRDEYDALRKKRDQISADSTQAKVEIARVESQIASAVSDIERYREEIKNAEEQINFVRSQLKNTQGSLDELENPDEAVELDESSKERLAELEAKLAGLDRYKKDMQTKLSESDRARMELNEEISRLNDLKYKEEFNLSKVDTDMENMQDRIWEEYQCTYETALAYKSEEFDAEKAPALINKLKRDINGLGFVNVNAIEDYKEMKARYDDMDTQRNDLVTAESDLNQIIHDLTDEMLERFTKGFVDINNNFMRIFKELFGGGSAKLLLEETESGDPLEAGIEIVAEPPGKKLQSISLLSGGEKALTAIAILFSILKLRPMPFCVLDEIEAALDDANVGRFASYLKNFSKETQFIVITHRKPTMELADALFGVTMEEKGVSKIVSVKLADAIKLDTSA